MSARKEIFAQIRALMGGAGFTMDEVTCIDGMLDRRGFPRDGGFDKDGFFASVRKITGPLDQAQVETINSLLADTVSWGVGWRAYAFATAWHEARLKPIPEIGKGKGRKYGVPGRNGGQVPYGRGLVQITWDQNYEEADSRLKLGGRLIANYELALQPDIAAAILVDGMKAGWFTGKSLGSYIGNGEGTHAQFVQARRIINGTDRAEMIAGYADKFQAALKGAGA